MKGKIFGIKTNAWTKEEKRVEVEYEIEPWRFEYAKQGSKVFQIIKGGVTGFESFIIEPDGSPLPKMRETGWCACSGTPNRWDKLVIPAKEMKKVLIE